MAVDKTEELIKKAVGDFLADGCPNYPKDKRGSWLKWVEDWCKKNIPAKCENDNGFTEHN